MTHEPKAPHLHLVPPAEDKAPKFPRLRKAAVGVANVLRSTAEAPLDNIVGSVHQINRAKNDIIASGGALIPHERTPINSYLSPIVETELDRVGNKKRGVVSLVFAGDSVFALTIDSSDSFDGSRQVEEVNLVELPLGYVKEFGASSRDLSPVRRIMTVNPRNLATNIDARGALKTWHDEVVGRAKAKNGREDDSVSREHFKLGISVDDSQGRRMRVDVEDLGSTNGTCILTADNATRVLQEHTNALGVSQVERILLTLEDNPTMFDPSLAGKLVAIPK